MFEDSFLSPIAAQTHTDGHYLKYCQNLINGGLDPKNSLEIAREYKSGAIYNNAAQVWNHEFFHQSISSPKKNEEFSIFLEEKCNFKKLFYEKAMELFGSGWTWLTYRDDGQFVVLNTYNANMPDIAYKPLLVLDMWEHSFYMDFPAQKSKYINSFLDSGINFDFLSENMRKI